MVDFDAIESPTLRREAQLFSAGMLAGANIGAVILHGLVAKGIFTKEAARALLGDAYMVTANVPLPPEYEAAIKQLFEQLKSGF